MTSEKKKTKSAAGTEITKRSKKGWNKQSVLAFGMAVVPFIGFLIFSIFPLVISFIALFCNVNLHNLSDIQWNDFAGFKSVFVPRYAFELFGFDLAKYFYKSIWITLWIASTQIVTLLISLVISALLAQKLKGSKVFQVLFFIPYICSGVAVAMMWKWIFNAKAGILNTIFGTNVDWLHNPQTMTWCIIVAIIWQAPGYGIAMYKSAINNVGSSLYEAASLDGANGFQKFWHVTVPSIAPTTFYLLLSGISAGLLTYDIAVLVIEDAWGIPGGEGSMGLTMMRLVYFLMTNTDTTDSNGVSYMVSCAAVVSWLLFIVTAVLSIIVFKKRQKSME